MYINTSASERCKACSNRAKMTRSSLTEVLRTNFNSYIFNKDQNMKFIALALLLSTVSSLASAAVATSTDHENQCTLYQAVAENDNGDIVLQPGQRLFSSKRVYGLSFLDLEIDFDRREARVQTMMNVVMGLNRNLLPQKSVIRADHPEFNFLVNQINRRLVLFEKICVGSENEIVYAKYYPTEE